MEQQNNQDVLRNNGALKFKTNINCAGCIAKVSPILNDAKGLESWNVDTTNPNKVLSVVSQGISEKEIIETVKSAGFNIEPLSN